MTEEKESVKLKIKKFERVFNSMWIAAKARKTSKKDVNTEIKSYRKSKNRKR